MPSPTQRDGAAREAQVLAWLERQGLRCLARNFRARTGEIDLILRDGAAVVFVEVRARRSVAFGGAAASVTAAKQRRLRLTAQVWLQQHYGARAWPACRFDVVALDGVDAEPQWLRDAF